MGRKISRRIDDTRDDEDSSSIQGRLRENDIARSRQPIETDTDVDVDSLKLELINYLTQGSGLRTQVDVCVCICVRKKDRQREKESERKREREKNGKRTYLDLGHASSRVLFLLVSLRSLTQIVICYLEHINLLSQTIDSLTRTLIC